MKKIKYILGGLNILAGVMFLGIFANIQDSLPAILIMFVSMVFLLINIYGIIDANKKNDKKMGYILGVVTYTMNILSPMMIMITMMLSFLCGIMIVSEEFNRNKKSW